MKRLQYLVIESGKAKVPQLCCRSPIGPDPAPMAGRSSSARAAGPESGGVNLEDFSKVLPWNLAKESK